jgi:hypothetical protein
MGHASAGAGPFDHVRPTGQFRSEQPAGEEQEERHDGRGADGYGVDAGMRRRTVGCSLFRVIAGIPAQAGTAGSTAERA